jgi:preprotein translocase subunit SecB
MTDTPPELPPQNDPAEFDPVINGADQAAGPGIRILAQFIRDLSFENPRAPESLRAGLPQPQIDLGVEMNARGRPDGYFEVDLKLSATALRDGETQFHCELVYGGLFAIAGVPEEELEPVLLIECPRFMFPFARRLMSDMITEGGFPPFMLDPIDFAGVYAQRKAGGEVDNGYQTV